MDTLIAVAASPGTGPADVSALVGVRQVLAWLGVLAGLVLLGWLVIALVRRRLAVEAPEESPFTLETLRELHRGGQLSDAEFARARDAMVAATRRAMAREAAGRGRSGGGTPKHDVSERRRR